MAEQSEQGAGHGALDSAIAKIRESFLDRLDKNFQSLESWADQFDRAAEDPAPLGPLAAEAHKISGIAKSVGFESLGRFAKNAENAINDHLTVGKQGATPESVLEMVDAMLCEIEATIATTHGPNS